MNHSSGFLQYNRENSEQRDIKIRVKDFNEFHKFFPAEKLNEQSARCMTCGVPFCHKGCPLGNDIPDFNDAVYRRSWKEAYDLLSSTNNFPEFTGRICPAPCESACVLGINRDPVTIEEIEKHIIEIAFKRNYVKPRKPQARTGKRIAVIGSGPAGLAAAAQLNYAGHGVTVFERDDEPGGLLMYGIPDFKLEKWVVRRRIKIMEEEGVVFKCHANIGINVSINEIQTSFDAIVLATGSTTPRNMIVPGRELKGIYFAMDFLKQQNKKNQGKDPHALPGIESNVNSDDITATGKNVVIIGGGDTGSDCVGTANRQNAKSILQITHGPVPPSERTDYMPWPEVPHTLSTSSSQEEGVQREWNLVTKEFVGDGNGNLKGIRVVTLDWELDKTGKRISSTERKGSEKIIPCDMVLLAMGFSHTQHEGLVNDIGVGIDAKGNINANCKDFQTSVESVFACGDARKGQSLVVWAISEGRECAKKVDEYLMGNSELESKDMNIVLSNNIHTQAII